MELKLTYDTYPSTEELGLYYTWENYGLMTGNSAIGGAVLGGVQRERIQLNDKSLWSGGPSQKRSDYIGGNIIEYGNYGETLGRVRELFCQNKVDEAVEICGRLLLGSDIGYGINLSYGNMYLDFDYGSDAELKNYKRELDLQSGIITVEYDISKTHYTRTTYTSYPDNVLITKITAEGKDGLNLSVAVLPDNCVAEDYKWNRDYKSDVWSRKWKTSVKDGLISISGAVDDNQMRFASHTKIISDGKVIDGADKVSVCDAKDILIITSIGDDYKNVYPNYRTGENDEQVSKKVLKYVNDASAKGYEALTRDHIADYRALFDRVELSLDADMPQKTTIELLDAYRTDSASAKEKRYLETLFFQMGRYLVIQSSRETPKLDPQRQTLPANLQGLWVATNNTMWHADYHLNVNQQMIYLPNYVANLVNTAEPLVDYIDSLREPGRVTAHIYAGIETNSENPENGFMAHTQNTPFGWTCPGWCFNWGWGPTGLAWLIHNIWEYYEYTEDLQYLKNRIYPIMRECAVFFDQYLMRDKDGYLVASPSFSPEHGPYTNGNTYEQSILWQLYEDTVAAASVLGVDDEKIRLWKANQAELKGPVEIGDSGQIKEWYEEGELGKYKDGTPIERYDDDHFHISHLVGLFPGNFITPDTPELLKAALCSINGRSDNAQVNWARAWRSLCYSRALDGENAYKFLKMVICDEMPERWTIGKRYNGLTSCRIFQIEGSLAYTSAVCEALMQSNAGYISILPALSEKWQKGSVYGLLARGNFELGIAWSNCKPDKVTLLSKKGNTAILSYKDIALASVTDSNGNKIDFTAIQRDKISFETKIGECYTVIFGDK